MEKSETSYQLFIAIVKLYLDQRYNSILITYIRRKCNEEKIKQAMSLSSAALTVMSAIPMSLVASVADAYANETTETNIQTNSQEKTQPTYRNVMYYGDWSIYGGQGNYFPKDMPADQYTHINFAFVDMDSNGDLLLPDQDAAFASGVGSGHEWGSQLGGIIPALAALREKIRISKRVLV